MLLDLNWQTSFPPAEAAASSFRCEEVAPQSGIAPDGSWAGRFTTAAEVDAYLSGEAITCLICWRESQSLSRHLGSQHEISSDAYRERFGISVGRSLVSAEYRRSFVEHTRTRPRVPEPAADHDANAWQGKFGSSNEVEVYLAADTIHCLVCFQDGFRSLDGHVRFKHGLTTTEYRDRFGIPHSFGLLGAFDRQARAERTGERMRSDPQVVAARARLQTIDWSPIFEKISAGGTLREVCDGQEGRPTRHDMERLRRIDPTARAALRTSQEIRGQIREAARVERRRQRELGRLNRSVGERCREEVRAALLSVEAFAAVERARPEWMRAQYWDDVRSEVLVRLLAGEITEDGIDKAIGRAFGDERYAFAFSLDAPVRTGSGTYLDRVPDPNAPLPFTEAIRSKLSERFKVIQRIGKMRVAA